MCVVCLYPLLTASVCVLCLYPLQRLLNHRLADEELGDAHLGRSFAFEESDCGLGQPDMAQSPRETMRCRRRRSLRILRGM